LSEEEARRILEKVVKKMDDEFAYLSSSCRNELEYHLAELFTGNHLRRAMNPSGYLFRALQNAAKKHFLTIGKHRKYETCNSHLDELQDSSSHFNFILRVDILDFEESLPERQQDILRAMMWGQTASEVAKKHRLSNTTISKDRKNLIQQLRIKLGDYQYDRN